MTEYEIEDRRQCVHCLHVIEFGGTGSDDWASDITGSRNCTHSEDGKHSPRRTWSSDGPRMDY